ncbi:hypothetical protein N8675_02120 [Akkermansiaceae bacterium]|nr:hypothetical protein [Akkermansiaceae bacterium]
MAYKQDVDDMRESPTFELMDLLRKQGAEVDYYHPHLPKIMPTREHTHWTGKKSIEWNKDTVPEYDTVVISTNHKAFNLQEPADWSEINVDTRNAMKGINGNALVVKA